MKLLFDFFPILLFFLCFKLFGIYTATTVTIIASILQVVICWVKNKQIDLSYKITLGFVIFLGGATLLFHNPVFIKWKPTVVYWVSAAAIVISYLWKRVNLLQKLMEKNVTLSKLTWNRLNLSWTLFLFFMGAVNLYVAYAFNTETWVNFKFFGGLGLTALFVLIQALYLSRYANFTFGETRQ